jgi:hypothetical protein
MTPIASDEQIRARRRGGGQDRRILGRQLFGLGQIRRSMAASGTIRTDA